MMLWWRDDGVVWWLEIRPNAIATKGRSWAVASANNEEVLENYYVFTKPHKISYLFSPMFFPFGTVAPSLNFHWLMGCLLQKLRYPRLLVLQFPDFDPRTFLRWSWIGCQQHVTSWVSQSLFGASVRSSLKSSWQCRYLCITTSSNFNHLFNWTKKKQSSGFWIFHHLSHHRLFRCLHFL